MVRKMRIGQIQAAAITGIGLAYLEPSFYALHIHDVRIRRGVRFRPDRYAPFSSGSWRRRGSSS